MVKIKNKGTQAERELLHKFWENQWACVRIAGSGSTSFPSPDLLAGKGERKVALECKTFKREHKYLEKEEVEQLLTFSRLFGAEPWLALKFDREPWHFLRIEDLYPTGKHLGASLSLAHQKGLKLADFLSLNQKI